jgi:hypothetical protein
MKSSKQEPNKEAASMFASIRIYDGVTDVAKVGHAVEKLVLPILKEQEGFVSYKLVTTGVDSIISISVFDTSDQADAANSIIRKIVKDSMRSLLPYPPKAVVGEVISYLEK